MRSLAYLGIALGALCVGGAALADDVAPSIDSLAKMPPNPVTSTATEAKDATAAKDAAAAPAAAHDEQPARSESSSTVPASETPVPAPTSATAAVAAQPPAQPKKICRSMDASAGSKIPRRVCATQEEWAGFDRRAREDAQDGLRRAQDHGAIAPAGISQSGLPP